MLIEDPPARWWPSGYYLHGVQAGGRCLTLETITLHYESYKGRYSST